MTLVLLPSPSNSHTIHVGVELVGASPRIGFFDANGMLLDTSFRTLVSDSDTGDQTCQLELSLQASGKLLFVQAKQHSPLTSWQPSSNNSVCTQTVTIGASSNPDGVQSSFNVVVCDYYGDPAALWIDPTWPLSRAGSGGPKAAGAPALSTSYFYLDSLGSITAPKQLTLYVNVAEFEGTPYAWLSNADGVCVGSSLVMCPPVGSSPSDLVYCQLQLLPGSMPSGYSASVARQSLPSNVNLYYGLSSGAESWFDIDIANASSSWTTTVTWYGQTSAPGPVWTNT
jgi:hypothetical protein